MKYAFFSLFLGDYLHTDMLALMLAPDKHVSLGNNMTRCNQACASRSCLSPPTGSAASGS